MGSLLQPESLDAPSRGFFWRRCTWLPHPALVPVGSHLLPAYFVRDGDIERLMHNGARDSRAPLHQRLVWAELSESLRDMSSLSFSTRWAPTRGPPHDPLCAAQGVVLVFLCSQISVCAGVCPQGGERKPGHQRIPVNSQDEDGLAAVHWAAMRGPYPYQSPGRL